MDEGRWRGLKKRKIEREGNEREQEDWQRKGQKQWANRGGKEQEEKEEEIGREETRRKVEGRGREK